MCDKELRLDGETGEEWLDRMFETDMCGECGQDKEWHKPIIVMGHWFSHCAIPEVPTRMYQFTVSEMSSEIDWVGCCHSEKLYAYAESKDKALELIYHGDAGLCSECMCELLSECGSLIGHALPDAEEVR